MASIEIRKAQRKKALLRLGIAGPSGAGKTMSSLKLAKGIAATGKICIIDTERGSADLYSDLYDYSVITLKPPYKPQNYAEAIKMAEEAGFEVIIIDSLSHAWSDEGGLLDQADKLSNGEGKNRFNVWSSLTPQHRVLVNAMLNSSAHIIATVRSKQAYELEEYTDSRGNKKSRPVKMGMAPVQREGMEYEFTVFMDINSDHFAKATKDRTAMFKDEVFMIDEKTGARIREWLDAGVENETISKTQIWSKLRGLLGSPSVKKDGLAEWVQSSIKVLTGLDTQDPKNYPEILEKLSQWTPEKAKDAIDRANMEKEIAPSPISEEDDEPLPDFKTMEPVKKRTKAGDKAVNK